MKDKDISLQIWDSANQKYNNMISLYYKGAKGIILMYDINNQESFDSVQECWKRKIEDLADSDAAIMLVGNKKDKKRVVSKKDAEECATSNKWGFCEVSTTSGNSCDDMISELGELIIGKTSSLGSEETRNETR